jgi:hypothetical protein
MLALLSSGRTSFPRPQFQLQWLCNIHQKTQFNVSQPNFMTLLSMAASDLRFMIGLAHSVDFLSLPNFSTAHATHPQYRFQDSAPEP